MNNHNKIKFLVDGMLGNLAKKLRLLGYDTKYFSNKTDDELIKIVNDENRILITRDEELSKRTKKLGLQTIFLTETDELNNFLQIKNKLNIKQFSIKGDTARCTLCNGKLMVVNKNQIIEKIPTNVAMNEKNFWECESCSKIYWEGTHILHLQEFVRRLND